MTTAVLTQPRANHGHFDTRMTDAQRRAVEAAWRARRPVRETAARLSLSKSAVGRVYARLSEESDG